MASFTERMIGAAKLDVHTYEEVEADPTAMGQAMGVVVLSAVAAGIGMVGRQGAGLIATTIMALVGWFVWALLTYLIGAKLMPEPQTKADLGQLLRTIGFSAAPGVFRIFAIIPILGLLISVGASIWMLVAMVIAVRQALDYTSTGRAVGVVIIGFLAYLLVGVFFAALGAMGRALG